MNQPIAAWQDNILSPVDKLEVHKRGLKHPAVSVFLKKGNEILLQQRSASKYHSPCLWANTVCTCLLYTSPSPRDKRQSRMPSSA